MFQPVLSMVDVSLLNNWHWRAHLVAKCGTTTGAVGPFYQWKTRIFEHDWSIMKEN
jgi:hypothetical protein